MRRQTARTQVRQFLDDVQFEVDNQISAVVRDIQRELRDEFTDAARRAAAHVHRRGQAGPGGRPADPERAPAAGGELDQLDRRADQGRAGPGGGVMTEAAAHGRARQPVGVADAVVADLRPGRGRGAVAGGRRPRRSASGSRARCRSPSPAGSRPASRRCSTPSSASGWRRPTPASARASCRGTARARATRSSARLRDGRDQPLDVPAATRARSTSSSAASPSATCAGSTCAGRRRRSTR